MDDNENKKHFGPGFLGAFATDQRFHDYILRDFCGCGAYGEVWQAEDISGRRLAIKIVSKQIYGSGWTREFNGIKNYCRLISSHPNLIQIMHVGEDDKYFFYTMELADNLAEPGRAYYADTLADRLAANGPFASDQLVILTQHLLNGIGALHHAGLIHRDIKPANIIFINGVPKLSDIGFVAPRDASISLAGTIGFIPPEELLSENESSADKNCQYDIYALGKVMYCALTGLPPDEYPSLPESISFGLSKRLNQVICMACCKNPTDRIASIDEFRQLLMAAANGEEKLERQKNSKPSGNLPQTPAAKKMAAAAIILMVIIILCGMFMLGGFFMLKDQIPKNINITVSGDKSASPNTARTAIAPSTVKPANAVAVKPPPEQAFASGDSIPLPVQAPPLQQPEKKSNRTVPELNMQMIYIEPGTFIMGEGASKHRVTISRDFWIGKYEVTQQEYQKIMDGNPSVNKGGKLPVEFVSWGEAADFCEKLTGRERNAGRLPEGYVYRLPTQAEWEYAARGGNKSKNYIYSGDNNIDAVAWHKNNSGGSIHEVGTKPPNELGLYDMSGNVWELCLDWYGAYSTKESVDPINIVSGKNRVMCGGCYSNSSFPGARSYTAPENKHPAIGFRVVLAAFIPEAAVAAPVENKAKDSSSPKQTIAQVATMASQPAKNSNWTVPEFNIEMAYVETGTFMMGEEAGRHQVTISRNFWIGRYEITQQEYEKIIGSNPSQHNGKRLPVECVSWNEATAFCDKLTETERRAGRLPEGYVYRLPTAAEWEYAARGGNKSKGYAYSGSNDIDTVAWHKNNAGETTHEVGTKPPNELGLYDMSGNVWELCLDWYGTYSTKESVDPVNLVPGKVRVICGGGYIDSRRPAYRGSSNSERKNPAFGFRIVLAAFIPGAAEAAPAAQVTAAPQPAKEEKNSNRIVPELNMQMVYVEPGTFMMGSNNATDREKPVHRVTLTKNYWIGKYEVTQQEYQKIMGSNPSAGKGDRLPVECVSWNEAVNFCDKLTEIERRAGRLPDGCVYRLPTLAESEFAARGGNKSKGCEYCGSNDINDVSWWADNSGKRTHDVGTKLPNELGIYDMGGNVWEWCHDRFGGYSANNAVDPAGPESGRNRSFHGGSCGNTYLSSCQPASRHCDPPDCKSSSIGFRVALAAPLPGTVSAAAQPATNSNWTVPELNMSMIYVESGTFMMGSNNATEREKPVHRVTLTKNYWIGKYEVTQQEYQKIMGDNPSSNKGDRLPVECVTRDEAVDFCNKLTVKENNSGRLPSGYVYRLPTEAEWEYAARGGGKSRNYIYSGSHDINAAAWNKNNSDKKSHEVGTKLPNELGIHDMSGNVWEWCLDLYDAYSDANATDPSGPASGPKYIQRGGSWDSTYNCELSIRNNFLPYSRRVITGFRVALAPVLSGAAVEPVAQVAAAPQPARTAFGPVKDKSWSVPELGMELLYIRPGSFMMGSARPEREWATGPEGKAQKLKYENDEPEENTIQDAFWMGRTKVTVGQWRKFIDAAGYRTDAEKRGVAHCFDWQSHAKWMWMPEKNWRDPNYSYPVQDNFPVTCVSWNDATAFCQWLTESEHQSGRLPPELEYRLPSETEWEYACRGGKAETRFWWGNDWNDAAWRLNAASSDKFPNGKSFQGNCGTEDRWTFVSPVDFYGEKGRNGFGLADMLGNTWEWCLDEADDSSTPEARILRGGAFDAPPGNLRIAGRICDDRSEPCAKYGFRIVCGAVDNPEETVSTSSSTETSAPQFPVWFYNGHYYRLFNECVSWNIAKKRCEEMGGYLVSIETPGENSFIYGNIKTVNGVIFTGATYEANAGVWRWSGSNKKLKFLRWDIGQPVSNKDYAAFSPISRKDRWGSYDGTVSSDKNSGENIFGFICEWENAESANKSLDTKPAAQDENIKDSAAVQTNGLIIKIFTPRKKLANTRHLTLYAVINRSNTKYILCQDKDIGRGSTNIFVLQYPKDITEIGSITLEAETGDCWAPESFIFEFPDNKIWTFTGQVSFVSGKDKILEYNAQPSITFYFTGLKTGTIQTSNPYINKVPDWAPHVKGICAVKPASSSQAAPAQTAPAATTQTAPPIAPPAAAAPAQTASDDLFMRGERRKRFMARYDQDRKRYNETEVREIEELYQAASRQPGSQEILEGFNKLVNKYPQANRAGCALLCMGMRCADRLQAEDYLRRAIADYSDCWYGNGVQVGAYARFYLAGYYRQSGRTQEAEKLYQEIKDKYPDAITPNGKPLANELPK